MNEFGARVSALPSSTTIATSTSATSVKCTGVRRTRSNVSNENKTPLTSIQACADTLLEGGLEDAEHSRMFLSRIIEQSDRLQMLIQDILRLARIESQSEAYQLQPVPVSGVLQEGIEDGNEFRGEGQLALGRFPAGEKDHDPPFADAWRWGAFYVAGRPTLELAG
jgi:transcription termination factor NusB